MERMKETVKKGTALLFDKHLFALCYLVLLIARSVFYLQSVADLGCKLCFAWGAVLVLAELWKQRKNWFRVQGSFFPLLLCVLFVVSILLNYRYNLFSGAKNLIYTAIYFFVLFAVDDGEDQERFFAGITRTGDAMILLNTLICIASLITFLMGVTTTYELGTDVYKVGFWFNRLNGVSNCNMATMLGLISVLLSALNLRVMGKIGKGRKVLYITHAVVQLLYYSLSGSRAATLCAAVVLVLLAVTDLFRRVREKKGSVFAASAVAVLLAVVFLAEPWAVRGLQLTMKGAAVGVNYLCDTVGGWMGMGDGEEGKEEDLLDMEFDRIEDFESGDSSNGRSAMWQGAFAVIRQKPIFGTADAKILDADGNLRIELDESLFTAAEKHGLKIGNGYFHNGFIQILLCGGAVFFLSFLVFGAICATYFIVYLIRKRKNFCEREYGTVLFLFLTIVAVLVDNLVEAHLLFSGPNAVSVVFWYLLGCGVCLIRRSRAKEKEKKHYE